MEESLDGSDAESNYSGISNEDFEEADEDVEEQDAEPLSSTEEESEAEDMSTADVEEGFPADDDVLYVENAEEVLSVSDDGDVLSATHPEDVHPESDADFVMSASDADDVVPTANEVLSEDESEGAAADLSQSLYVKEEQMNASDMEPTYDEDFEELDLKQESLASDAELLPSTCKESGQSRKSSFRGQDGAVKHGSPFKLLIRQEEANEDKFESDGIGFGGPRILGRSKSPGNGYRIKSGVKRNKKQKKEKQFTLPLAYTGPRVMDGKQLHCYYCKSSFKFKSRLKIHITKHFPPKYSCRECGKKFNRPDSFKSHRKLHSGVGPYRCHLCDYFTGYGSSLRAHFAWHETTSGADAVRPTEPNVLTGDLRKRQNQSFFEGEMTATQVTKWKAKKKAMKKLPPPYTGPRQPGDGYFHCYYCPKACKKKAVLGNHMYCHLPLTYFCKVCGYGFSRYSSLWYHEKRTHTKEKFECQLCNFKTKFSLSLTNHVTKVHATPRVRVLKPPLTCFYCGWTAKSRSRLVNHMSLHKSEIGQVHQVVPINVDYFCGNCEYKVETKQMLHTHVRTQHPKTVLKCACCDYKIKSSMLLMNHLDVHSGKHPHTCRFCGFICSTESSLTNHKTYHNADTDFKCPECPFSAFSISRFAAHLKRHGTMESSDLPHSHGDTPDKISRFSEHLISHNRRFKCPYCPYATPMKHTLDVHINAQHTKRVHYKCDFCDFKTAYRYSLKQHTNTKHTRSNWFKCHFCNFQTLLKTYLRVHELNHTDQKPYACDMCDYRTKQKKYLLSHKLRHTGERAFKCDLCNFSDYTKTGIARHKKGVHATVRPFKCIFCGESFKTKQTAQAHEIVHTGDKRNSYSCSMCSFKTPNKSVFLKHTSRMHPETPECEELPDTYPNGRRKRWYFCTKCAFTTCSKPSLPRHMKERHPSSRN